VAGFPRSGYGLVATFDCLHSRPPSWPLAVVPNPERERRLRQRKPGAHGGESDHSRALPEGSASTRSTLLPAWAKTCASHTAEVVFPVPGFKLARARISPVI
jgi:hypothetical protein